MSFTPGLIVKQNASTDDAFLTPSSDAVDCGVVAVDVVESDTIVELCFLLVGKMTKTIP